LCTYWSAIWPKGFEAHRVVAISQFAHASISGQLARQWGNECFPTISAAELRCDEDESENAGFTTGTPWFRVNSNYQGD